MNPAQKATSAIAALGAINAVVCSTAISKEPPGAEWPIFVDLALGLIILAQLVPLAGVAWLIAGAPPTSTFWRRAWKAWVVFSVPGLLVGAVVSYVILRYFVFQT